jgi:hypothetical protein
MFKDFGGYLSVFPPYRYYDTDYLLKSLEEDVIAPVLNKSEELAVALQLRTPSALTE